MTHPWIRRRRLAASEPDHRQDDGRAIDPEHDQRRRLDRLGDVQRKLGQDERADHREEQDESHGDDRD
jgi:hypothetical protein